MIRLSGAYRKKQALGNERLIQPMKKWSDCEKIQRLLIAAGMSLLDWKNARWNPVYGNGCT